MLQELIRKNRTYRRFYQEAAIERHQLAEWVDLARQSASGANLQPLKYILSADTERNGQIFLLLKWAGYLKEWDGPVEGERPSAYIVMLHDKEIRASEAGCDYGISCQSILLGATEAGYGGCIIQSVDHDRLRGFLRIPEQYDIVMVIALGKPKEQVVMEEIGPSGDVKYYRDVAGVHHVPKRRIEDVIVDF